MFGIQLWLRQHVHPTTSKTGKFLVREALPATPAVPAIPQVALFTGWEKQWQQDQQHEEVSKPLCYSLFAAVVWLSYIEGT